MKLKKLKEFFAGRDGFNLAFLMGSYVPGRARKENDVYVAVLFVHSPTSQEVISLKEKLEKLLEKVVDLVVLTLKITRKRHNTTCIT